MTDKAPSQQQPSIRPDSVGGSAPLLTAGQRKKIARTSLRAGRVRLREFTTPELRHREAELIRDVALSTPEIASAQTITTYEPLPVEPDVSELNTALLQRCRVLVPITLENLDLSWRDLATGEDLGLEGISLADVVMTPGLAVSPLGQRLGQGGGCYDRALPRRKTGVPVVTIVHSTEVNFPVVTQLHDQPVDMALTTDGLMRF